MLKDFCVIIGTKKGGTSSLYEYLKQHPKIVGGFIKEPNFFGNIKKWEKGLQWYQKQFIDYDPDTHKFGLDATTDYTQEGFIGIPKRMKDTDFNFKFIYILRDPFDKIESQTHQFLIDRDTIRPIYECLDVRILESAKYYKQLSKYLEYFSKDQFMIVDFSRMKYDIEGVMGEITNFLGIPEFNYDTSYIHNLKSSAKGQSYRGYRLLRSILRKLSITPMIPQKLKDRVRKNLGNYGGKNIVEENYSLSEEQKEYVAKQLKEDIKSLEREFGFSNKNWKIFKYYD